MNRRNIAIAQTLLVILSSASVGVLAKLALRPTNKPLPAESSAERMRPPVHHPNRSA
jgi:hypothetical protein